MYTRMDPMRSFGSTDSTPEWIQPRRSDYGLSARCMDSSHGHAIQVNRSQKPVQQSELVSFASHVCRC